VWLSPESGSVVLKVPTVVLMGSFSATLLLLRLMSVGGSFAYTTGAGQTIAANAHNSTAEKTTVTNKPML
jgi:hypothetical protein